MMSEVEEEVSNFHHNHTNTIFSCHYIYTLVQSLQASDILSIFIKCLSANDSLFYRELQQEVLGARHGLIIL
jgi:hypothetical protein